MITKLRKLSFEKVLFALTLIVFVYVLIQWFFPIATYYTDDEWFVLPERAWFSSRGEWLRHLLFFPQTRITFVGDYLLVRPGLFLWAWLQDVMFRSHRLSQQIFSLIVAVGVLASLVTMIWRECGRSLAMGACVFAFTCVTGHFAWSWAHLSGYFLAIAFYTLAMSFHVQENLSLQKSAWVAGLLVCAVTFHEFVAIALVPLLVLELISLPLKEIRVSNLRLTRLVGPLLVLFVIVGGTHLLLPSPAFFSTNDDVALRFDWTRIYYMGLVFLGLLVQATDHLVPLHMDEFYLDCARRLVGVGVMVVAARVFFRSLSAVQRRRVVACLMPVLALSGGLLMTRVATRLVIKEHYYPIFQFFLVMVVVLVFAPALRARPRVLALLTLLLLASSVRSATIVHSMNLQTSEAASAIDRAVGQIKATLGSQKSGCYAGLFYSGQQSEFNAGVNIALLEDSCGRRAGSPTYFFAYPNGGVSEFLFPDQPSASVSRELINQVGLGQNSRELEQYLLRQPLNLPEASRAIARSGEILLHPIYSSVQARDLTLKFVSEDSSPRLLNVGLKVGSISHALYFLLLNNNLKVLQRAQDGSIQEIAFSPLGGFGDLVVLRIVDIQSHCLILVNGQLLTQIESCLQGERTLSLLELKNGTSIERLVGLSYF